MKKAMLPWMIFCASLCSGAASPDNFAIKLEQVPGTHDVLVVGSWEVGDIPGWSWGICFDPGQVRVGDCQGSSGHNCPNLEKPEDILTRCGSEPGFHSLTIFEDGITQGVVRMGAFCDYDATPRFEMLKISFELLAEEAAFEFCDTLSDPQTETGIVHRGDFYRFGSMEGITLYNKRFIRGDSNADGRMDIADAITVFTFLFRDRDAVGCHAACDANDDGLLDLGDVIAILNYLFLDTGGLPEPFSECGFDPTRTLPQLDCVAYEPCG